MNRPCRLDSYYAASPSLLYDPANNPNPNSPRMTRSCRLASDSCRSVVACDPRRCLSFALVYIYIIHEWTLILVGGFSFLAWLAHSKTTAAHILWLKLGTMF
jgi:hypothetical protein